MSNPMTRERLPLVGTIVICGTVLGCTPRSPAELDNGRVEVDEQARPPEPVPRAVEASTVGAGEEAERALIIGSGDRPDVRAAGGRSRLGPCRHRPRDIPADAALPEGVDELFAEALGVGARLTQWYPQVPDSFEVRARIEFNIGCVAEAEASWSEALRLQPDYAYALHGLGLIAAKRCDHHGAVRYQRRALEKSPGMADAVKHLAEAHLRLGDADAAIAVLAESLRQAPGDPDRMTRLGHAQIAAARYADAERWFRDALAIRPDIPRARYGLAVAVARQGKAEEASEAEAAYREARSAARRERSQRRRGDQIRHQREIAEHYVSACRVHLAGRRIEEAATLARRAGRLNPESLESRELLVTLAAQLGDTAAAFDACHELIALAPGEPSYRLTLGMLHERAGQPAKARAVYERLIDDGVAVADAHAKLAQFHHHRGSSEEAIRHARVAASESDADAHLALLAQLLAEAGRFREAARAIDGAIERDPQNPDWRRLRGLIRDALP